MRLIVVFIFLPILALAQDQPNIAHPSQKISHYINAYINAAGAAGTSTEKISFFLNKLSEKREKFKNDRIFLDHVFTKTHQHILKNYKDYATFDQLIDKGDYNCLTGTALYALILEHFGFEYRIIETNYHMFLQAETSSGSVLFEATDPLEGYLADDKEIEKRITQYRLSNYVAAKTNKTFYQYNISIYNTVDLEGLLGLLHYNMAVEAYNNKDLKSSIANLEKACSLYESQRLEEFSEIILITILESKIQPDTREDLLRKIQSIRRDKLRVTASVK